MSTIGIDPSVVAPAFAIWPSGETLRVRTTGEGAARLANLYRLTVEWAQGFAPNDLEAIFIERPVGKFPKRALDQASGVLQVAILAGTDHFDYPVSCFELSPGEWKKTVLGNGAAKKPEVHAWAERHWTGQFRLAGVFTQDEADALAIACAGSLLLGHSEVAA